MFVVTGLSLLLLVYVGFGDGKRTYEQFHIEKLTAHGRIVQNSSRTICATGLPLKQYAGFTQLSEPLVRDREIDALVVYDQIGRRSSSPSTRTRPLCRTPPPSASASKTDHRSKTATRITRSCCRCAPASKRSAAWS